MLLQQRQRATVRRGSKGRDPLVDQLVRDALIVRAEADLRWLDLCEERLVAPRAPVATRKTDALSEPKRARARSKRKERA
jgi:hypothetical protein